MWDNAVGYHFHLIGQGLKPEVAAEHVMQRFGVSPAALHKRIHGGVADRDATRAALAAARTHLLSVINQNGLTESEALLRTLYNAITGENL